MKKSVVRAGGPKSFQTGKTFEEDAIPRGKITRRRKREISQVVY
jgi:hypothetical protein